MPYPLFKRLKLESLKPIKMAIEMTDRSIQSLKGIKENVLVKISNLVFPVDFIILDIMELESVPIILGRSMLATAHTKIDVYGKKISLGVGNNSLGDFDDHLSPEHESQDIISLSPSESAEIKENFSTGLCGLTKVLFGQPFKEQIGLVEDQGKGTLWFKIRNDKVLFHMPRAEKAFRKLTVKQHNSMRPLLKVSDEDKKKGIHKPEKKIKGFYRGCLGLRDEYKYDQEVVDWIQGCIDDGMT
ncbi:putative reverse transcriptase, RNA-dependent DNA polymerase [Tanacetum coccineum]